MMDDHRVWLQGVLGFFFSAQSVENPVCLDVDHRYGHNKKACSLSWKQTLTPGQVCRFYSRNCRRYCPSLTSAFNKSKWDSSLTNKLTPIFSTLTGLIDVFILFFFLLHNIFRGDEVEMGFFLINHQPSGLMFLSLLRAHRMFGWKGCNWLIHFNILSTLSVLFHLFTFGFLWLILFITWTEICNDVPLRRTSSFLQWIGNVTLETDFKLDSSFICFYFCIYSWSWTLLLLDWKLTRRLMRGIMNTLLIIKLFKLKLVIYFNVGAKWHVAVFSNDKLFVFKYSDKHWTQVCKY